MSPFLEFRVEPKREVPFAHECNVEFLNYAKAGEVRPIICPLLKPPDPLSRCRAGFSDPPGHRGPAAIRLRGRASQHIT